MFMEGLTGVLGVTQACAGSGQLRGGVFASQAELYTNVNGVIF